MIHQNFKNSYANDIARELKKSYRLIKNTLERYLKKKLYSREKVQPIFKNMDKSYENFSKQEDRWSF